MLAYLAVENVFFFKTKNKVCRVNRQKIESVSTTLVCKFAV